MVTPIFSYSEARLPDDPPTACVGVGNLPNGRCPLQSGKQLAANWSAAVSALVNFAMANGSSAEVGGACPR